MPKVGKGPSAKHFPYTPAGEKAAKEHARMVGAPMPMPLPKPKAKKKGS